MNKTQLMMGTVGKLMSALDFHRQACGMGVFPKIENEFCLAIRQALEQNNPAQDDSVPCRFCESLINTSALLCKSCCEMADAIEDQMTDCPKCNGDGYHHGFGEHGRDPDWCDTCGGGKVISQPIDGGHDMPGDVLHLVEKAREYFEPLPDSGVDSRSYPDGCIYLAKAISLLKERADLAPSVDAEMKWPATGILDTAIENISERVDGNGDFGEIQESDLRPVVEAARKYIALQMKGE